MGIHIHYPSPKVIYSHPDGPFITFDTYGLMMTAFDGTNTVSVGMGPSLMAALGWALIDVCRAVDVDECESISGLPENEGGQI